MSDGITIDPQQLNDFATQIRGLVTSLNSAKLQLDADVTVDKPVRFGQGATFPASLHVSTTSSPIVMFRGLLLQRNTDFDDNFKTLTGKLNLIADTADAIAKNYKTAADLDKMSADDVNALLNATLSAEASTTTSGTTTGM